ncbi:hypothetical protein PMAYCL1PPCAC_23592, partial [Pristionchus mayeri]
QKRIEKIEKEERGKKRKEGEEIKRREEEERKRREEAERKKNVRGIVQEERPKKENVHKRAKGKKEEVSAPSTSLPLSSHLHSIGGSVLSGAAAAVERLRLSSGWITDLYHHYLLHVLASLGRAFPALETPEPPPRRGQIPYPLQRGIRRALPSVEVFAVRYSSNDWKKEVKKERKR